MEPERPALGDDESVSVDAPVEVEDEPAEVAPEPSEAEIGPVLELPEAVEEAVLVAPPELARAAAVPEQARGKRGGAAAVVEVDARTAGDAEPDDLPDLADDAELTAALEAILLVVDEPVAEMQLAQILEQPTERVGLLLEDISARYTAAGHGFDLRRAAGGWRLYTRPEYAAYVERFVLDGQSVRLTQAALETLAVVAYKQPVTRSRISAIRGVNCDGVMRTLATRGLIEECGVEGETGAHLYRTTDLFLEKLGLNSVDQLPPLAPFLPDDVEEVLDAPG
ncbi:SMC-Scp complex subunit ScpB [Paractinoplanes tereljensis]|uniref:SMC-Scp complex subunit ScpB n=1 Tax=Paractinoplanes tereljensis TaxID=571912 RepID=UPI0027DB18CF|nr:SMC-Scp complex subunit ScpB [Actinoplanes tereljensis]